MSYQNIESLISVKEDTYTCVICLESGNNLKKPLKCNCNLYFHPECYKRYIEKAQTCPMCRENIPTPPTIFEAIFSLKYWILFLQGLVSVVLITLGFVKYKYHSYMMVSLVSLVPNFFLFVAAILYVSLPLKCCSNGMENLRQDVFGFCYMLGISAWTSSPVFFLLFFMHSYEEFTHVWILSEGIITSVFVQFLVGIGLVLYYIFRCVYISFQRGLERYSQI